ncbi:MAG: AAA family ATPase [Bacteriovoracaceae bacterium]
MENKSLQIIKTILVNEDIAIFRIKDTESHKLFICKTTGPIYRSAENQLNLLKKEFEISNDTSLKCILHSAFLTSFQGKEAFFYEDFDGITLEEFLKNPIDLEVFLKIAINITSSIGEIHSHDLIHKDLKLQNLLINPSSLEIKITGFGLSSKLIKIQSASIAPNLIEGTFPYMSPEQTGRMNRTVDNRSDLYSLGILFFKMLTQKFPFEANTSIEWIHSHIARIPSFIILDHRQVPETLKQIIKKLLEKMADDRYQSANGLLYDLKHCLKDYQNQHLISIFKLGEHDSTNRLIIPQKLYGRENDIAKLVKSFYRVVQNGQTELALISGYSGIGKSSLVNELHRPVSNKNGFFVTGKFDQYKRDIPYFTFAQAFNSLILTLLTGSEVEISDWREKIAKALNQNGKIIIDVIPELQLLIGPQPEVPTLPLIESLNRFKAVFQNFIKVFAEEKTPLTLFLDDLQWADSASLALLKDLALNQEIKFLFIVGAYRDNEVTEDHPLNLTLKEIRKINSRVIDIVLLPLTSQSLNLFVSDTLHTSPQETIEFTDLLFEKTAGNPFFVIQFLTILKEERLIHFDEKSEKWNWDLTKIKSKGFTDNLLSLVLRKFNRLKPETIEILKKLACLGNKVNIELFETIYDIKLSQIQAHLWEALDQGILNNIDHIYEFQHDRLHEAAYSLIDIDQRPNEHLFIARSYLSHFSEKEIDDHTFDLAGHFNKSASLIVDKNEKELAIKFNLKSALKSRTAAAFSTAVTYCQKGIDLLEENSWETQYEYTFALMLTCCECELAIGRVNESALLIRPILEHANNLTDLAAANQIQVSIFLALGEIFNSIEYTINFLQKFNIKLSPHPTNAEMQIVDEDLLKRLKALTPTEIINLPIMNSKDIEGVMGMLGEILPSAYFTDVNLHRLIAYHMVDLTLKHGVSPISPMGFAAYGLELSVKKDYHTAQQLGEIATELVERHNFLSAKAKISNIVGVTITPWVESYANAISMLYRGVAAENSDIIFSSLCRFYIPYLSFDSGKILSELASDTNQAIKFIGSKGVIPLVQCLELLQRTIISLKGETFKECCFGTDELDENEFKNKLINHPFPTTKAWYYLYKMILCSIFNETSDILDEIKETKNHLHLIRGQTAEIDYVFYSSLAITSMWKNFNSEEQKIYSIDLLEHRKNLEIWSKLNPNNFYHHYQLIEAEYHRIHGDFIQAEKFFDQAIKSARDNEFVHIQAIAFEKAALFYKERNLELISETYFKEARTCYFRWGATAKVKQIDNKYLGVLGFNRLSSDTLTTRPEEIDIVSIFNSSMAISSEIDLNNLNLKLLKIVLEQSGSQNVSLLLSENNELFLEATAAVSDQGYDAKIVNHLLLDKHLLPVSIIRFVQRTNELVIYDHINDSSRFANDYYLRECEPKSILCLPILRGTNLIGVIYLENRIARGVFSQERLNILKLIASQAAISLQNAQYYRNLIQENLQRKKVEEALRSNQEQLQSIIDSATSLIYVKDLDGKFILVNSRVAELFKSDKSSLIGKSDFDFQPKENAIQLQTNDFEAIEQNQAIQYEESIQLDDGLHTYLSVKFPLHTIDGKAYAVCGISTDITDRKQIEREREQLLVDTQKSVQLRDDFISIASHELRTPLTPLRMYLDILKKSLASIPSEVFPRINIILNAFENADLSVSRLSKLTEDLLDISRITANRFSLNLKTNNLSNVLINTIARFKNEAELSSTKINTMIESEVMLAFDQSRIEQVFENLISNAIKYGRGGTINIVLKKVNSKAHLEFEDHGIGISKEEIPKIFDRFVRAVPVNNYGGLGLGLYIAKEIIVSHNGKIWVESELNKGSTFYIELPIDQTV